MIWQLKSHLAVISSTYHDVSVLAGKYLVGHDGWMIRPMPSGLLAGNKVIRCNVYQSGNLESL